MEQKKNSPGMKYLMLANYAMVILGGFSAFAFNGVAWILSLILMLIPSTPAWVREHNQKLFWKNSGILILGALPLIWLVRTLVILPQTPMDQVSLGGLLIGIGIGLVSGLVAIVLKILVMFDAAKFWDDANR